MPATISVGDWIGNRFQVFDVHEGGMSLVYVVTDHLEESGRKVVALKTLRSELLQSRVRVSRFAAECRIWTQLGEHPHIVRAHSVEIFDGRPYVVLELVQGGDLYRWIGTPRLDLPQTLRFGYQFCVGLEHALRQGLHCHRDIKPGNLLVTENGILKITDFGLARVCEEMVAVRPELPDGSIPLAEPTTHHAIIWTDPQDQETRGSSGWRRDVPVPAGPDGTIQVGPPRSRAPSMKSAAGGSRPGSGSASSTIAAEKETQDYVPVAEKSTFRLTRTGARLGTGAYMAPEQFRDPKSVDVRADIYSFGIVLFEMITGQLPFKGRSMESLDDQHTLRPPGSVVPSIPARYAKFARSVDALVQRCLKKEPEKRFRCVAELRQAIKQVAAQFPRR